MKDDKVETTLFRPFVKKYMDYQRDLIEYPRNYDSLKETNDIFLTVTGPGSKKEFGVLVTNEIPNYDLLDKARNFYLYNSKNLNKLDIESYNVAPEYLQAQKISLKEVMPFLYGVLNSPEYKQMFGNDLKKELPKIPLINNKEEFINVGSKLIRLHLNYEEVPPCPFLEIEYFSDEPSYEVKKMKFGLKLENGKKIQDKSVIQFNNHIKISNIPSKAYEYKLNGKSIIEWIMKLYIDKIDSKTRISDNPNEYSEDPKYVFNLLLSIINVSIQTAELVNSLPAMDIME